MIVCQHEDRTDGLKFTVIFEDDDEVHVLEELVELSGERLNFEQVLYNRIVHKL